MLNFLKNAAVFGLSRESAQAAPTDEYFKQTTLLLHGDGTNGAQNNTFLDSSSNTFTITRNGNTTQGTFSPFSNADGEWSNYFDGSGDYLQLADSTAWDLTGDYTIEMWLYKATGTSQTFFQLGTSSNILLYQNASNQIIFYSGGAIITASTAASLNTWNHVALVRNGGGTNNTVLYLNGVNVGQATNTTSFTGDASNGVRIGAEYPTGFAFNGYISNVSVLKTAKYTGAFTPSSTPLNPSETNQELLTCYSNRFVDANTATTSKTITANGNVAVQPYSPFAPSAAYSPSVNGGSGYFDGTGDYLETPSSSDLAFGTGDFCVEFWIYRTVAGQDGLYSNSASAGGGDAQFEIQVNSSNKVILIGWTTTFMTSSASLSINEWNHVAVVRSGTSMAIFINGNREATATSSNDFSSTNTFYIGAQRSSAANPVTGYISGLRSVKGASVYDPAQTTVTVPTAPPTAISNTQLLLNFTNSGIFDQTRKNNIETIGNAQVDTSTVKLGTGSMKFDGTGDALAIKETGNVFTFGSGDFTYECWIYPTTGASSQKTIFGRANTGNLAVPYIYLVNSTGVLSLYYSATVVSSTTAPSSNSWTHIAVSRENGTSRLFINGVLDGSAADTTSLISPDILVVGGSGVAASNPFIGYMDEVRITKGVARYTANFTPQTEIFPDL